MNQIKSAVTWAISAPCGEPSIGAGRVALNILSFSRPAYTYGIYYGVYVVDWHGPPTIRDLLNGSLDEILLLGTKLGNEHISGAGR